MKVRLRTSPFAEAFISRLRPRASSSKRNSSLLQASSPRTDSRNFTLARPRNSSSSKPSPSHWLSTTQSRIGKCIHFGLTTKQCQTSASILQILSTEWRPLLAGQEGYLTSPERAGVLRQKVVWGDMDIMGHVNNVRYVRWAESARVNMLGLIGRDESTLGGGGVGSGGKWRRDWEELCTPKGERGVILRGINVEYKFPVKYPDHISVFHKLRSSPSSSEFSKDPSSFTLDVMIISENHRRIAARCVEDIVVYDYKNSRKTPVPNFMKGAFQKIWEEQEEMKRWAEGRIEEVEGLVRGLERESWDSDDAVEDLGGGKGGVDGMKM